MGDIISSICEELSKWAHAVAFFTDCKFSLDPVLFAPGRKNTLWIIYPQKQSKICRKSLDDLVAFFPFTFSFSGTCHLDSPPPPPPLPASHKPCGQRTLRSYGWAYWFLWWAPPPLLILFCPNRKQERFILQSSVHPRRPMIGDVYGGEKPGMTNKGWTLEWQGSASRGSVCSVDPGGHSPSARGVVSYWWHCCWFQCEGGRRSPTTIPLVK